MRQPDWRIVLPDEPDFPGFTRVIWTRHVSEMSDLPEVDANVLMTVVFRVERLMRDTLTPDKINLASLGNQVPHLHWHIIPRFQTDSRFPDPVWAPARRQADFPDLRDALAAYHAALTEWQL